MTNERWEKVHTVSDYWDGPILGVADVGGVPHLYEKVFSEEEDDYINRYRVMPIDQELYSLLMESWAIFVRWRIAFDQGKTPLETHPALPEDRDRRSLLEQAIGDRKKPHSARSNEIGGQLRRVGPGPYARSYVWEVQWQD
jgi:hypothetical protein